jgi:hypothetical protein
MSRKRSTYHATGAQRVEFRGRTLGCFIEFKWRDAAISYVSTRTVLKRGGLKRRHRLALANVAGTTPGGRSSFLSCQKHVRLARDNRQASIESMSPKLSLAIIFSDGVIREQGTGKHTLIGCFQVLNAPAFPWVCQPFFVTAFIENLPLGELITAKASVENAEGAELGSVTGQLKLETMLDEKGQTEVPFPFRPISFVSSGEYAVRVLVAEQEIGRKSLFVRSLPQLLGSSV